jgi:hypothetical protein
MASCEYLLSVVKNIKSFHKKDPFQMYAHAKGRENGKKFPPEFMSKYMLREKAYGLSGNVTFTLFFLISFSIYSHKAERKLLCFNHNHGGILALSFFEYLVLVIIILRIYAFVLNYYYYYYYY